MPAASKAQQRFMGMVHAADKGETPASPEVAKVSADMKDSDAKDFASTKHDGLPDHVKEQLKSVVREVIREKNGMNEMSSNDVHFKHIMKLYDKGGSFTKKKIGAVVCKNPKATRKDIEGELFDADYKDIIEFEDELGFKESYAGKEPVVTEEFKHVIHVDTPTQVVSKPVAAQIMALAKKGVRASEIGLEMGFVGNAKLAADTFQKVKNKIYFELDKRNESVNEVASISQVRSTIEKVKKQLIQKWKQKGGYENFGEREGRMLSDKFNTNPYGSSDERRIHSMIQDFENWAMNYDGRSESVNEGKLADTWQKNNKKGYILKVGDIELKSEGPSKTHTIYKNGYVWGNFQMDYESGGTDWWVEPSKGNDFYVNTIDDIVKRVKADSRFNESVNEEHDCGCNENHDCGCGGVHEHHINEDINADANGIAGLTASRANAVKDFIEKNNINSNKLYLSLKKGGLKDRMDFVTALVGKPGNPIQKKVIAQFSN